MILKSLCVLIGATQLYGASSVGAPEVFPPIVARSSYNAVDYEGHYSPVSESRLVSSIDSASSDALRNAILHMNNIVRVESEFNEGQRLFAKHLEVFRYNDPSFVTTSVRGDAKTTLNGLWPTLQDSVLSDTKWFADVASESTLPVSKGDAYNLNAKTVGYGVAFFDFTTAYNRDHRNAAVSDRLPYMFSIGSASSGLSYADVKTAYAAFVGQKSSVGNEIYGLHQHISVGALANQTFAALSTSL
jgi:hypothetical protein